MREKKEKKLTLQSNGSCDASPEPRDILAAEFHSQRGWGKSPTGMEIKVEGERMRRLLSLGAFPLTAGSDKCLKSCPLLVLGHVKDDRAAGFESCQDRLDNTRSWHFKMFQIDGDANSKVRKKTREGANNALEQCAQYQEGLSGRSAVTRFQKNE